MFDLLTFIFSFPSGADLGLWVGLVAMIAAASTLFWSSQFRNSIPQILWLLLISLCLALNSLAIRQVEHELDRAISNSQELPQTPLWMLGSLGFVICLAIGRMCFAFGDERRTLAFMYATLAFVAGAALSQCGFFRFYADPWALANSICWLAAGVCFCAFLIGMALDIKRAFQVIRPSEQ